MMEVTRPVAKPASRGFSIESLMARDSGGTSPRTSSPPSSSSSTSSSAHPASPCACPLPPDMLSAPHAHGLDIHAASTSSLLQQHADTAALLAGLKSQAGLTSSFLAARPGIPQPHLPPPPPHHPHHPHPHLPTHIPYHVPDLHPGHPAALLGGLQRTLGGGFPTAHHPHHPVLGAVPKAPFPIYSWLAGRPGYLGFSGAEPAFLLPFRKPKRIRTAFSPSQLLRLEHAFEKNHYVVGQERKELAQNLSLTETQVKVWFQNRRTKYKRVKAEEDEEGGVSHPEEDEEIIEEDDEDIEGRASLSPGSDAAS